MGNLRQKYTTEEWDEMVDSTKPNKMTTRNIKFANYDKVNKDGVMDKNTLVED